MAKRMLLAFIVLIVVSGGVFAQDEQRAANSLAVSLGVFGAELSYERIFSKRLSILGETSYTTMLFMDEFTVAGKGRLYPFAGAFFLELGLGYSYGMGAVNMMEKMLLGVITLGLYYIFVEEIENPRTGGFLIQPGLGWKIDIGKPDGFILPISAGLDIKAGSSPDFTPYVRIGLGYSF
jgi:hypothetical protein